MNDLRNGYILIIPIKNEIEYLSSLKETILNQTLKPLLWVIVDGHSTDGSYEIAKKIFQGYEWIHVIKQKKLFDKGYSHMNFAEAINEGFIYAKNVCSERHIEYSFIGKTDATPILSKDYFEILINEMKKNSQLVITCGKMCVVLGNKQINTPSCFDIPLTGFNDIRLYKKEFFNGYPIFYSPDGILLIKAINRGYEVKIVNSAYIIEKRLGGSKIGIWNASKLNGKVMYCLGYHPLLALLNLLYSSFKFYPHYQGLPILIGYLNAFIKNERKINDKEVSEYYWRKRLKEVIKTSNFFNKKRNSVG